MHVFAGIPLGGKTPKLHEIIHLRLLKGDHLKLGEPPQTTNRTQPVILCATPTGDPVVFPCTRRIRSAVTRQPIITQDSTRAPANLEVVPFTT